MLSRAIVPRIYTDPSQPSRPTRLKRRFGVSQPPESQLFAAIDASLVESEPPHKKYRALFDESDPDRLATSDAIDLITGTGSLTQQETPSALTYTQELPRETPASLAPAPEEDEESALGRSRTGVIDKSPGLKRKMGADDGDVNMSGGDDDERPTKRGAIEAASTQTQPPAGTSQAFAKSSLGRVFTNTQANTDTPEKSGAAPGKPDRDEVFLKAVATTKKGKKQEDLFDREFNDLRISKPDLANEQATEDWAVLADFGDDSDLRGNFMEVVEIEVFRKDNTPRSVMRTAGGRADWEGRPDFKKFKKVSYYVWCMVQTPTHF